APGARSSASPPTTTEPWPGCRWNASGPWSRSGPTGPSSWARWRGWSRCSRSRTGARRSGSPCTTPTGRSTPTRSWPRGPPASWTWPAPTATPPAGAAPARSWRPRRTGERVVAGAPGWLAFVPFAARWPFEVHLFATRHLPDLPALEDDERDGLAALLEDPPVL